MPTNESNIIDTEITNNSSNDNIVSDIIVENTDMTNIITESNIIFSDSNITLSEINNSISNIISVSQSSKVDIFPKNLESSGYVILVTVALFFSLTFIFNIIILKKIFKIIQESYKSFYSVGDSLYIQQQIMEYRLLLVELNSSNTAIEKTNARTQLYNFLNSICLEICTSDNKRLVLQLAKCFLPKIHSRYAKLQQLPDGLIYFQYVGKMLSQIQHITAEEIFKILRKEFQYKIKEYQDTIKSSIAKI